MTEMAHDDDFLDELASAYLDGEVTSEERAQVEADPALVARVERLRAVRTLLAGDIDELDRTGFDDMRLRALAALDEEPVVATAASPAGAVTALDAARQRRTSRIWKPLAAAAGAAAIGVAAISGIANLSADDSSDQSSTASEETLAASAEAAPVVDDGADKDAAGGGSAADSAPTETIGSIGEGAEVEGGSPLAADSGAAGISAAAPAAGATETTAAAAEEAATTQPTAVAARVALATEDEVVALADEARDQLSAGTSPAPPSSDCPDLGLRWGAVVWRGTPADLYLDVASGTTDVDVAVVATADCTILLSVTVP